ncbi:MAG: endonuclease III [Thermoprotei archaeon]|nr:MAG: endonuclease III [Thermoprotei archaeon]
MATLPINLISSLEEKYSRLWWSVEEERVYEEAMSDPFKALVFTLLSQNTSSKNTHRAYLSLASRFNVDPWTLSRLDEGELAEALRPGGLHRVKARRLKQLARRVAVKLHGRLDALLSLPLDEARRRLKELPGVGDKTADVLLSRIHGHRRAYVVDTHMRRLALRLGLVSEGASYRDVQEALMSFIPWSEVPAEKHERLVGLLWLLAKHTCQARRPRCWECPLRVICRKGKA